jgi:DNA-binding response OmpR family regulator
MKNGKYLILCVDDDGDILEALRLRLEKAGYLTATALSAEEGLKKFKETQPDLIIADLMMEEIDSGTGLVKELKLAGNRAPVLLLSSLGDSLTISASTREMGLDAVFQKPVNFDAMLKTIRAKLGQQG